MDGELKQFMKKLGPFIVPDDPRPPDGSYVSIWVVGSNNACAYVNIWKCEKVLQQLNDVIWQSNKTRGPIRHTMYHPLDLEYCIHTSFARKVYMVWCASSEDSSHNLAAARILVDQLKIEIPPLHNAACAFTNVPRGPVIFIQTLKDEMFNYDATQFKRDWPLFFRTGIPSLRYITTHTIADWNIPIQVLSDIRLGLRPALPFVQEYLLEKPNGTCSQTDRVECMLLGSAIICIIGQDKWNELNKCPKTCITIINRPNSEHQPQLQPLPDDAVDHP